MKTILTLGIRWALASAALAEQPAPVQSAQSLRRAVALLDYVAGDYGRAVGPGGEVLSPDEFKEQQQFVLEAAREVRDDAGPAGEDLVTQLQALHSRVAARASPAEVSMAARCTLRTSPAAAPSTRKAAPRAMARTDTLRPRRRTSFPPSLRPSR